MCTIILNILPSKTTASPLSGIVIAAKTADTYRAYYLLRCFTTSALCGSYSTKITNICWASPNFYENYAYQNPLTGCAIWSETEWDSSHSLRIVTNFLRLKETLVLFSKRLFFRLKPKPAFKPKCNWMPTWMPCYVTLAYITQDRYTFWERALRTSKENSWLNGTCREGLIRPSASCKIPGRLQFASARAIG